MKKSSKLRRAYIEADRTLYEVDKYLFPKLARKIETEVNKRFDRFVHALAKEAQT